MCARALVAILLAAALSAVPAPLLAQPPSLTVTVDVAEDFAQFVATPLPGDTEPKRGSFFLTEGRIFPAGTIEGDGATFDPSAHPAIGTWLCRGTHLADGADIVSGKAEIWVATTQNYLFPDDRLSIATEGREGTRPMVRTVVGGTGPLKYYVGEQRQQLLGFNATGGVNLRVTFVLRRAE